MVNSEKSQPQTEAWRTTLRLRSQRLLATAGVILVCAGISVIGQKRKPARATSKIDYTQFQHTTKQHQEACHICHKAPSANWKQASGFPDIADFPDHDACVRCHRSQFFKGVQPAICSNCHSRVSPRGEARFAFRNEARPEQFKIDFPHDKHQDVIAAIRADQNTALRFAHALQRKDYNNCTICHSPNRQAPKALASGWVDGFVPSFDSFKTTPASHAACFNCHWKGQEPTANNCAGCHKPAENYFPDHVPHRISMKFRHEGGGEKGIHAAECTTCHINITKSASLKGLKPDVPITGCTECHNKSGLREDLGNELAQIDKNKGFVCSYCHTSETGKRDPPPQHYMVADRPPLTRKEIK